MGGTDFTTVDFAYGAPAGGKGNVGLSIFADRAHLRENLREDAAAAGLRVTASASLDELGEGGGHALGDVVLIDCPQVDARGLAMLSLADMRAARSGVRLIVSTSVEALDAVFACMDQSSPALLVDPSRAERVLALGHALADLPSGRVRELSDDDRLMLLRLTEQVGQIAGRIERLAPASAPMIGGGEANRTASAFGFPVQAEPGSVRSTPGELPDARLVRRIIRHRQLRARFIAADLFADPAWDMLLDLTAARVEGQRVSVTSLCIASGVPPTTALRWIGQMVEAGLFVRVCDDSDRRRAFIELSERAVEAMARYFSEIALTVPEPV